MPQSVSIADFLKRAESTAVIDVRSEGEYRHGHIPGAVNIPLFNNEERALVGTYYKKEGREKAIELGLEIVGPKMAAFVKKVKTVIKNKEVLVHCWRGGMRSGSVALLLEILGYKCFTLQKGYKAYRNYVLSSFEKPWNLLVLGGKTGSGKTTILQVLKEKGQQIIDLEALANHKGSSFGALGENPQPTTEHFENLLFTQLSKINPLEPIWIEDESHSIGKVLVPITFWNQLRNSPVYFIDLPKELRIQNLLKDYAGQPVTGITDAVERIKKRLGGQHYKAAMEAVKANEPGKVADITLTYYDKAYMFGLWQREKDKITMLEIQNNNTAETAELLMNAATQRIAT